MRIGYGFDAHCFQAGRPLILTGVTIPHPMGLAGHSDADVVLHAVCDALLGAAALGDLGGYFPSHDSTWENTDSRVFLRKVYELLAEQNYQISNVDVTIIAQTPQLSAYREAMRANLAEDLQISLSQVSIKATTTDGMGAIGRKEGIAAHAVVLLMGTSA